MPIDADRRFHSECQMLIVGPTLVFVALASPWTNIVPMSLQECQDRSMPDAMRGHVGAARQPMQMFQLRGVM